MNYTLFSYVLFLQASDKFYRWFIKITFSFPLDIKRVKWNESELNECVKSGHFDVINFYEW